MKVDQYRVQKAKEYSFLVPVGMDLGELNEAEKGYLVTFEPYVLEQHDVEIDTIVTGSDLAMVTEDLQRDRFAMILHVPVPSLLKSTSDEID